MSLTLMSSHVVTLDTGKVAGDIGISADSMAELHAFLGRLIQGGEPTVVVQAPPKAKSASSPTPAAAPAAAQTSAPATGTSVVATQQAPAVQAPAVQAPAVQAPAVQAPAEVPGDLQDDVLALSGATSYKQVFDYVLGKFGGPGAVTEANYQSIITSMQARFEALKPHVKTIQRLTGDPRERIFRSLSITINNPPWCK